MVVKRQSASISGRRVTGLDDMERLIKSGGGVAVMDKSGNKKDKLSFRGTVDILDVIATDVGGGGKLSRASMAVLTYRIQSVFGKATRSIGTMVQATKMFAYGTSTTFPTGSRHCQARQAAFHREPLGGSGESQESKRSGLTRA
jgi:hypothetical protein